MNDREQRLAQLHSQFEEVQAHYSELEIISDGAYDGLVVVGRIRFLASYASATEITDSYIIRVNVPLYFSPFCPPKAYELAGKIDRFYHHYIDGSLCLGVPVAVKLKLLAHETLLGYIEYLLVPYLYAHSYFLQYGAMPFGDNKHNDCEHLHFYETYFAGVPKNRLLDFLLVMYDPTIYRMHRPCLCGGKRILRKCHGDDIRLLTAIHHKRFIKQDIEKMLDGITAEGIKNITSIDANTRKKVISKYIHELRKDEKLKNETAKMVGGK